MNTTGTAKLKFGINFSYNINEMSVTHRSALITFFPEPNNTKFHLEKIWITSSLHGLDYRK